MTDPHRGPAAVTGGFAEVSGDPLGMVGPAAAPSATLVFIRD
ncbi:hypothetical protein ACWDTP_00110 [Mycobacterium sp. NPDC003449]